MAVYGVFGTLYFGAITGIIGTGGTKLGNVEARQFDFTIPRNNAWFKTSRDAQGQRSFNRGTSLPLFILRARDVSNNTINLMFQDLAASGEIDPDNANTVNAASANTAFLIVPNDPDEDHLYIPRAEVAPEQELTRRFSPSQSILEDGEVAFSPAKLSDNTEPAYLLGASASIIAAYAGIS